MQGTVLVIESENAKVRLQHKLVELDSDKTIGWKPISDLLNGAFIEHVNYNRTLRENNIDIWVDDCGKLEGLEPSVILMEDGEILDVLAGNVVFTSFDDEGNTLPLSEEQIKIIKDVLHLVLAKNQLTGEIDIRYMMEA